MSEDLEQLVDRLRSESIRVYSDDSTAAFSRWALMAQAAGKIIEQADEIERLKALTQ